MTDILGKARAVQLSEITLYDACVFAHFCDLRKLRQNGTRLFRSRQRRSDQRLKALPAQCLCGSLSLSSSVFIQFDIPSSLNAPVRIPLGLSVSHDIDHHLVTLLFLFRRKFIITHWMKNEAENATD